MDRPLTSKILKMQMLKQQSVATDLIFKLKEEENLAYWVCYRKQGPQKNMDNRSQCCTNHQTESTTNRVWYNLYIKKITINFELNKVRLDYYCYKYFIVVSWFLAFLKDWEETRQTISVKLANTRCIHFFIMCSGRYLKNIIQLGN